MAVTGFYADTKYGWAQNESATWTDDFEIAPANVYATAMLTGILVSNDGFLYSGIVEYRTKNPKRKAQGRVDWTHRYDVRPC
jgi:hypothetical protein